MLLIRKADQPLTTWSGGTTRQIYIFPEGSTYADRNFKIRISTATVEIEKSTFTSLPGYYRKLMVLEGELSLVHKDQHESLLKKFDSDAFLGEWETTSYGKATDFNVMTVEQYEAIVDAYYVDPSEESLDFEVFEGQAGFYVNRGELKVTCNGKEEILSAGDFILLDQEECRHQHTTLSNTAPMELIRVMIEQLF